MAWAWELGPWLRLGKRPSSPIPSPLCFCRAVPSSVFASCLHPSPAAGSQKHSSSCRQPAGPLSRVVVITTVGTVLVETLEGRVRAEGKSQGTRDREKQRELLFSALEVFIGKTTTSTKARSLKELELSGHMRWPWIKRTLVST